MNVGISANRCTEYDHIFFLNGYSIPRGQDTYYKYVPLDRFHADVEKEQFVFVSPEKWEDPLERRYLKTNFTSHGYINEPIACYCLTNKSTTNEAACWKFYRDDRTILRIAYNIDSLFTFLNHIAIQHGLRIYVGNTLYFTEREILSIANKTNELYSQFCPPEMKTEHYLSLLLLKRMSFKYESEVRIFVVGEDISFDEQLFIVKCSYNDENMIPRIMLEPYKTGEGHSNDEVAINNKKNIQEIINSRVLQSRLYSERTPVRNL